VFSLKDSNRRNLVCSQFCQGEIPCELGGLNSDTHCKIKYQVSIGGDWNAFKTGHIQSKINNKIVRLHRFVMGAEAGDEVRRIKGDRYDFRKECFSIKKAVN